MSNPNTLRLDGQTVRIQPGDTLLNIAKRHGIEIPTLCDDPRLDPTGACRMCLVDVDGMRRLVPSCATEARPGMVVQTASARVKRHQKALLQLYLADHPAEEAGETGPQSQIHILARRYGIRPALAPLTPARAERTDDRNHFIAFRADRCIACARCTRYCDEVEQVSAITLAGRGAKTTISTAHGRSLLDTTCELCGGCVAVCPTGAMTEKMPLRRGAPADRALRAVRTTCNYCGVGCQMDLMVDPKADRVVKVSSPPPGTLPNDGNLCVKGRFATEFIHHPDRLTRPLVRGKDGQLHEASWDEALARAAGGLRAVSDRHGADALGFVSSSRCTVEENYLVQKLARAVFRTHNVHQCAAT